MTIRDVLEQLNFGAHIAEQEAIELVQYFVKTDQWKRVMEGKVEVILGAKGSGKSAIYQSILENRETLTSRGIRVIEVTNPLDHATFRKFDPKSDVQFRNVWKLYFLCLLDHFLTSAKVRSRQARAVSVALEELELIPTPNSRVIVKAFRGIFTTIRRFANPHAFEGTLKFNELTGGFEGFSARIVLQEAGGDEGNPYVSIDSLIKLADAALSQAGIQVWIALDRLDAAFPPAQSEKAALRGLFRAYIDFGALKSIRLKIFLRNDIWDHIADNEPLREASHLTRETTLTWTDNDLLNLIVSRALNNPRIVEHYAVEPEEVKNDLNKQLRLFYDIFPGLIGQTPTFVWILENTRDGTGNAMPREVIHLLTEARDKEMRMIEIGAANPVGVALFDPQAIEEALYVVSKDRFTKTLCHEFPTLRQYMEKLRGGATRYTATDLTKIWNLQTEEAANIASELTEIGFFRSNNAHNVAEFEIPSMYRIALHLKEGRA